MAAAFVFTGVAVLTSCKSESKPAPAAPPPQPTAAASRTESSITTRPGVAGGVAERSFTTQAVVTAVDPATRRVTLKEGDGREYTFTARPEIKNLQQLHVNDKVTATFEEHMIITVRSDDAEPSNTRTNVLATAPSGDKPAMLAAEQTEKVARITAIDSVKRTADLQFVDGLAKGVPIRSDVDLSRYKVGDNVVIRVTTALSVLAETPNP
jgi:hypothetical protein